MSLLKNNGSSKDNYTFIVPENVAFIRFTIMTSNSNILKAYYNFTNLNNIQDFKLNDLQLNFNINLNNFMKKSAKTPLISWVDDDCNYEGIANVKNICDELNIKCTFACVTSGISSTNEDIPNAGLNNSDLKNRLLDYQNLGFHITSHSNHHAKIWQSTDETYSPTECEKDLITSLNMLRENGFLDYDFFIAPFGTHNTEIQEIAKRWTKALFSSSGGLNHLNGNGRYNINRLFIQSSNSLESYKNYINNCFENGDWLVLGTHSGTPSEFDSNLVKQVFQYAQSKNINIQPLNVAWKIRNYIYNLYEMF